MATTTPVARQKTGSPRREGDACNSWGSVAEEPRCPTGRPRGDGHRGADDQPRTCQRGVASNLSSTGAGAVRPPAHQADPTLTARHPRTTRATCMLPSPERNAATDGVAPRHSDRRGGVPARHLTGRSKPARQPEMPSPGPAASHGKPSRAGAAELATDLVAGPGHRPASGRLWTCRAVAIASPGGRVDQDHGGWQTHLGSTDPHAPDRRTHPGVQVMRATAR